MTKINIKSESQPLENNTLVNNFSDLSKEIIKLGYNDKEKRSRYENEMQQRLSKTELENRELQVKVIELEQKIIIADYSTATKNLIRHFSNHMVPIIGIFFAYRVVMSIIGLLAR